MERVSSRSPHTQNISLGKHKCVPEQDRQAIISVTVYRKQELTEEAESSAHDCCVTLQTNTHRLRGSQAWQLHAFGQRQRDEPLMYYADNGSHAWLFHSHSRSLCSVNADLAAKYIY